MKIKTVNVNLRRKVLEIETAKGSYSLPFGMLRLKPTKSNRISEIYVDPELGKEAVTYVLESGDEDSIHLDDFLEYNKDPEYIRKMLLYNLTIEAQKAVDETEISVSELARRLNTSRAYINKVLDSANHQKTIDQLTKVLSVLGKRVELKVA